MVRRVTSMGSSDSDALDGAGHQRRHGAPVQGVGRPRAARQLGGSHVPALGTKRASSATRRHGRSSSRSSTHAGGRAVNPSSGQSIHPDPASAPPSGCNVVPVM